ncbi:MAG TPA: nicotinate-nucleotide adenylyltransferase [Caulobacteraceae bacterium]|nr:nicotinate-nucleotide adenylyltransferase [Caulobacteraceae bacterium]
MWSAGPARRAPDAGRPGSLRLGLPLAPGMRVGLFGGSFNPAHDGHAHVAETALIRLRLARVIWLVSPQNPLKGAPEPIEARMAGAAAFAASPSMVLSDVETRLGSAYSIDTIRALKARHPGVCFVWVMGADNLAGFHRWKGWTGIFRALPIAVVARPGSTLKALTSPAARRFASARVAPGSLLRSRPPAWSYLSAPLNHASSTALRGSTRP